MKKLLNTSLTNFAFNDNLVISLYFYLQLLESEFCLK